MYKYTDTDLFETPERYFYSDCFSSNFISEWQDSRTRYIAKLNNTTLSTPAKEQHQITEIQDDTINTYHSLMNIIQQSNIKTESPSILRELSFFLKKYEISKRLYTLYSLDSKKATGNDYRNYAIYIVFGKCLANEFAKTRSLQYLSTLCKLIDTLTSIPVHLYTKEQQQGLSELLSIEINFIGKIAN